MDPIIFAQLLIAAGIYNVWLVRYSLATEYRGGGAESLPQEFEEYGLPAWAVPVVGALKIAFATMLLVGVWFPVLTRPAAIGIAVLMAGALGAHARVGDPVKRHLPAFAVLLLALVVALGA